MSKTLEEWVEDTCPHLGKDVMVHLKVLDGYPEEDPSEEDAETRYSLWRCIMISVRQRFE